MRIRYFGSIAVLFVTGGLALAQDITLEQPPSLTPARLAGASEPQPTPVHQPANVPVPPAPVPVVKQAPAATPLISVPTPVPAEPVWENRHVRGDGEPLGFVNCEFLAWWIRGTKIPYMVGSAPTSLNGLSPLLAGTIPGPLTAVSGASAAVNLVSTPTVAYDVNAGGRLTTGIWLDRERVIGLDGSFFQFEHRAKGQGFSSSGSPVLGPTYYDLTLAQQVLVEDAVNGAGARTGSVLINNSERLWGGEVHARVAGYSIVSDRTDFLIGFRHVSFNEGVTVDGFSTDTSNGNTVNQYDNFGTHNQFYGAELGFQSDYRRGRWFANIRGKVALGVAHEVVDIQGLTTIVNPIVTTYPGGIYAQPSNMGHHTRDEFAVVPELTANFGYQVTSHVRVFAGYNLLYMSNVVRPGDHVNVNVDSTQVQSLAAYDPTALAVHPAFSWRDSSFWAQGVNFGVEVRY